MSCDTGSCRTGWTPLLPAARRIVRSALRRGRRFVRDRRGNALVEIALAFPILALLTIGGVEIARYILIAQKIDKAAVTMADLVSQEKQVTDGQLTDLFTAVNFVLTPYEIDSNGAVVVSSVRRDLGDENARVIWQRTGAGTLSVSSHLGQENQIAALPHGMSLREDESIVVAEVFYKLTPFWAPEIVAPRDLYVQSSFRPRRSMEVELKTN